MTTFSCVFNSSWCDSPSTFALSWPAYLLGREGGRERGERVSERGRDREAEEEAGQAWKDEGGRDRSGDGRGDREW